MSANTLFLSAVREAIDAGFTLAEARVLAADLAPAAVSAESPVAVASPPKAKAVPAWIVEHAQRKAARRTLAAELRAKGVAPKGAAWTKAKKAAGIA